MFLLYHTPFSYHTGGPTGEQPRTNGQPTGTNRTLGRFRNSVLYLMAENTDITILEMDSLSKSWEEFDNTLRNLPDKLIRGDYNLHLDSCKKDCSNKCCTAIEVSTLFCNHK